MAVVGNINKVRAKLVNLSNNLKEANKVTVFVGYSMNYAVFVHEINANYRNSKQWKYLESVARNFGKQIGEHAAKVYAETKDIELALLAGARLLQRESQRIVPIDTGALKASSFVATEDNAERESILARIRGTKIRLAADAQRIKDKYK